MKKLMVYAKYFSIGTVMVSISWIVFNVLSNNRSLTRPEIAGLVINLLTLGFWSSIEKHEIEWEREDADRKEISRLLDLYKNDLGRLKIALYLLFKHPATTPCGRKMAMGLLQVIRRYEWNKKLKEMIQP